MKKHSILLIVAILFAAFSFQACQKETEQQIVTYVMPQLENPITEVLSPSHSVEIEDNYYLIGFAPNARLFAIDKNHPQANEMLEGFKMALANNELLKVTYGDVFPGKYWVITEIQSPSPEEQRNWKKAFQPRDTADVKPALRNGNFYLSSFQKATELFNFLRNQNCTSKSGTNLCIPFDYVADGCYARAHYMKRLMEYNYGVSCLKIVSASGQFTRLSVNATRLGCCQTWSWHIAPLLYVYQNGQWVDYVFDPAMFTRPVRPSEWLGAQQSTRCSNQARVEYWNVFSGDVYGYNPATGKVSFDANYTNTVETLRKYSRERIGCRI